MCVFGAICDFWAIFFVLGGFCVELVCFIVFDVKIQHGANLGQKNGGFDKNRTGIIKLNRKSEFINY